MVGVVVSARQQGEWHSNNNNNMQVNNRNMRTWMRGQSAMGWMVVMIVRGGAKGDERRWRPDGVYDQSEEDQNEEKPFQLLQATSKGPTGYFAGLTLVRLNNKACSSAETDNGT